MTISVTEAIERLSFNVAIARLMEFVGEVRSAKAKSVLIRLLAPFAPHLAEELWHLRGEPFSVHDQPWPVAARVARDTVEVVVQVNGKVRGVIETARGLDEGDLVVAARGQVPRLPDDAATLRTVIVPDRVVNFVT